MRRFQHFLRMLLIGAFIIAPIGTRAAENDAEVMTQVTCLDTWQDAWSMISTQEKSATEVFCDHFMGAKDIFDSGGKTSFLHVVPPFVIVAMTFDFPSPPSVKTAIPRQYVPYSLHPEVAPHPPKSI